MGHETQIIENKTFNTGIYGQAKDCEYVELRWKKERATRRANLTAYITSYSRITTMSQIMEIDYNDLIRVNSDDIYFYNKHDPYGLIKDDDDNITFNKLKMIGTSRCQWKNCYTSTNLQYNPAPPCVGFPMEHDVNDFEVEDVVGVTEDEGKWKYRKFIHLLSSRGQEAQVKHLKRFGTWAITTWCF